MFHIHAPVLFAFASRYTQSFLIVDRPNVTIFAPPNSLSMVKTTKIILAQNYKSYDALQILFHNLYIICHRGSLTVYGMWYM